MCYISWKLSYSGDFIAVYNAYEARFVCRFPSLIKAVILNKKIKNFHLHGGIQLLNEYKTFSVHVSLKLCLPHSRFWKRYDIRKTFI